MTGGGAERVISVLANEFAGRGIKTKILMTAGNECVYNLNPQIELFQAGEKTGGKIVKRISRVKAMRQYFRKNRDGILITFESDAAFFCCIAKIGLHMPMVSSERNDPASFGNDRVRKIAYKISDRVVFQTEGAKNYFPMKIQMKGRIIENPVRDDLPQTYMGKRKKTIACVGRFEKQKNHKMLLYAFEKFAEKHPEYTLHLYGKGSLENEIREFANQLGIAEKVIFEGFKKNIISCIIDAGMFVLSSDYEGIPNSLLEAMAIGLPVISTDCPCGGAALCIQNEVNGYLIPVGDATALTAVMEKIANSEALANKLGRAASEVRNTFSVQKIVEKWMEILAELKKE